MVQPDVPGDSPEQAHPQDLKPRRPGKDTPIRRQRSEIRDPLSSGSGASPRLTNSPAASGTAAGLVDAGSMVDESRRSMLRASMPSCRSSTTMGCGGRRRNAPVWQPRLLAPQLQPDPSSSSAISPWSMSAWRCTDAGSRNGELDFFLDCELTKGVRQRCTRRPTPT